MQVTRAARFPRRLWLICASAACLCGCLALLGLRPLAARAKPPQRTTLASAAGRLTYIAPMSATSTAPEVVLAEANGSHPQMLGPGGPAILSPNGKYVAAVTSPVSQTSHGSSLILYSILTKGERSRTLLRSSDQLTLVAWSPNANDIAVIDGDALVVVPRDGAARTVARGGTGTAITGASFAPNSRRLVYALASSLLVSAPVNLWTVAATGGASTEITHDGSSQSPLWGPNGIIYARATSTAPTYQLWIIEANGHDPVELTRVAVDAPFSGLEPIALSQNGKHLLANMIGQNTAQAWVVDLSSKNVLARELGPPGAATIGNAISPNGKVILLTNGYSNLSDDDFSGLSIEAVPWSGLSPTVLAAPGAFASWGG